MKIEKDLEDFLEKVVPILEEKWQLETNPDYKYTKKDKIRKLWLAYMIAEDSHIWQERKGGDPYFSWHVREVALTTIWFENPTFESIIIALLHDTVEDTKLSTWSIWNLFWNYITKSVLALSKDEWVFDNTLYYENLKHWDKNQRMVKVADRIHNLSTIDCLPIDKIKRKLEQSIKYIYPIANWATKIWKEMLYKEFDRLNSKFNFNINLPKMNLNNLEVLWVST